MPNYLLVAQWTIAGNQPLSIRAYAFASGNEATTQSTWDTAVQAFWNTAGVISIYPTTTSLVGTYTSTMTSNFKQSTKTQNVHSIPGTAVSAAMPNQVAFIATLRTALASKAGRGRWYLPAPAASALASTGNLWSASTMTAMASGLNAMGTALGSSIQLQILHRNATKSGLAALSMTPVTPSDCSNKPGIQRRRGDKIVPARTSWTP